MRAVRYNVQRHWLTVARWGVGVGLQFLAPALRDQVSLSEDLFIISIPVRIALLWSTPLAFYLLPATLVLLAWLWQDKQMSLLRVLGLGLLFIGLVNFPFILWLTYLWNVYYQPVDG